MFLHLEQYISLKCVLRTFSCSVMLLLPSSNLSNFTLLISGVGTFDHISSMAIFNLGKICKQQVKKKQLSYKHRKYIMQTVPPVFQLFEAYIHSILCKVIHALPCLFIAIYSYISHLIYIINCTCDIFYFMQHLLCICVYSFEKSVILTQIMTTSNCMAIFR